MKNIYNFFFINPSNLIKAIMNKSIISNMSEDDRNSLITAMMEHLKSAPSFLEKDEKKSTKRSLSSSSVESVEVIYI